MPDRTYPFVDPYCRDGSRPSAQYTEWAYSRRRWKRAWPHYDICAHPAHGGGRLRQPHDQRHGNRGNGWRQPWGGLALHGERAVRLRRLRRELLRRCVLDQRRRVRRPRL